MATHESFNHFLNKDIPVNLISFSDAAFNILYTSIQYLFIQIDLTVLGLEQLSHMSLQSVDSHGSSKWDAISFRLQLLIEKINI